ncbi:lysM and putative peptidoglycan-binding domain-containing protein 3-like [Daphnia carinata]|uniref:lysM and putative peptidoglycan-binding domain-containing protein 3-like n=1 Tax=Daphnia carinata TaxID=120202 RepID=UPI00257E2755|nr:lysM and putative peptidoglycan-binding domain-containing protein 3-like [Daphnia carinata]
MTNRSYGYSRLISYEEKAASRKDSSTDDDNDSLPSTKLRRLTNIDQRKERWPGSASHLSLSSPSDIQREYREHLIKPKETLQGLALHYRCTVFELKVANNIQKEAEFFARRTLKIPVRQHSSLTERLPSDKASLLPCGDTKSGDFKPSNSLEFLKQVDQDLQRLKEKARVYDIDSNDPATSTFIPDAERLRRTVRLNRTDCQGDDCGLSWTHILGMALLVLLACPLLYFLYLELNLHKSTKAATHDETVASLNVSDAL